MNIKEQLDVAWTRRGKELNGKPWPVGTSPTEAWVNEVHAILGPDVTFDWGAIGADSCLVNGIFLFLPAEGP